LYSVVAGVSFVSPSDRELTSLADEEQTQEAAENPGVEAQLDALLGRIEEEQAGHSDAETAAAVSSSPEEPPETAPTDSEQVSDDDAIDKGESEPTVDAAEAGTPLADQVQELLDQDRAEEEIAQASDDAVEDDADDQSVPPADAQPDEPVPESQADANDASEEVASDTDPLGVQIDQLLDMAKEQEAGQGEDTPTTLPPDEEISDASAKAPQAETSGQPAMADAGASEGKSDSEAVKDLDSILADSADDAVAGDYETIEQVLAEEQAATAAPAAQTDTTTPEAAFPAEPDDDELPEGMFEAPEQIQAGKDPRPPEVAEPVAAPAGGGDFTARAEDVAKELAEQPESLPPEPEAPPVTPTPKPTPTPGVRRGSRSRSIAAAVGSRLVGVAGRTPEVALQVCTTINKPVRKLPAEWQNTVGYVGLLTLFNATLILIYGLLSTAFAG